MDKKIPQELIELAHQINSSLDLATVLKTAMKCAEELMDAEASSIFQVDEATGELFFRLARGPEADKVREVRLKLGEGVAGWVALTGEPIVVADAASDPLFNPTVDAITGYETRSLLCVPLKHRDTLVGVVEVLNKRAAGGFNQEDLELLRLLADQIAVALDNARQYERLADIYRQVVHTLSATTEMRDPYTAGHQRRVADIAAAVAREMGASRELQEGLRLAGLLHDIGKMAVPAEILSKPGRLSEAELNLVKTHCQAGYEILKEIKFPYEIATIILQHHERLDGSGYPAGLKGEEITKEARILAVADVVETVGSHRPYRPSLGPERALEEISRHRGTGLDPEVVDACLKLFRLGFRLD